MNITKNIGMLLLAIYLILQGIFTTGSIHPGQFSLLLPALAIASGIFILLGK